MATKRTLDTFFQPAAVKKARLSDSQPGAEEPGEPPSHHPTYAFPVSHFPRSLQEALSSDLPASNGKEINNQPELDLLYFQPYIPKQIENEVFEFLRGELFFYRVKYKIKRGSLETDINTPRL